MTARAPPRPRAVRVVPSMGSTAMSVCGGEPSPIRSPLKSIGRVVLLALADDHDAVHGRPSGARPAWRSPRRRRPPPCRPGPSIGWRPWRRPRSPGRAPWPGCGRGPGVWRSTGQDPSWAAAAVDRAAPPDSPGRPRSPGRAGGWPPYWDRGLLRRPAQRAAVGHRSGPVGPRTRRSKLMAACLLAEGRTRAGQRAPHRRRRHHGRGAGGAGRLGRAAARRRPGHRLAGRRRRSSPRPPTSWWSGCGPRSWCSGPCWPAAGCARVSMPGGDDFGSRPIDIHLNGLSSHGRALRDRPTATWRARRGRRRGGWWAARVVLEYPSHTATDNLLMAAVLAKGTTVIENAAREPEVVRPGRLPRTPWGPRPRRRDLAHRGRGGGGAAPGPTTR